MNQNWIAVYQLIAKRMLEYLEDSHLGPDKVNRFERGALRGESGVIEAPRSEGWGPGFVSRRHLFQVDCVTVKLTQRHSHD